jgi:hypothetical protein
MSLNHFEKNHLSRHFNDNTKEIQHGEIELQIANFLQRMMIHGEEVSPWII